MGTDPEQALWFRTCHVRVKAELSARSPKDQMCHYVTFKASLLDLSSELILGLELPALYIVLLTLLS